MDEFAGRQAGRLDEESRTGDGREPLAVEESSWSRSISDGPVDPALAEIVEVLTLRVLGGQDVDLQEYIRANPGWEPVLRILLGTLRELAASPQRRSQSANPEREIVRPTLLGDFAILREVGRGGMGIVYEARQLSLGRRVALKVLSPAAAFDDRSLERFRLEAHAAACLHHPHIVPVYAIGSHEDMPYYAMQYIDGATLAAIVSALRRIRDGEPSSGATNPAESLALGLLSDRFATGREGARAGSPPDFRGKDYLRAVVRLTAQIAEALEYAHEQGILHRDIKPGNLLLDQAGKLWVTDFGLARIVGNATLTAIGELPGTLRYMSPEQIQGTRALIDRRSDIYSLGVTLYELLALEPAVGGQERWEILASIDRMEPRRLSTLNPPISPDLVTIVAKAIAKDASARYATAREFGQDLVRFLEGRPIKARRANAPEQVVRWVRRNPVVAGLLTALVAGFIAGFAAVTVLWRRADAEASRANIEASRASATARAEAEARSAEARLRIQAQVEIARQDFDRGLLLADQGDADRGRLWMAEGLRQTPPERPDVARQLRANLTSWELQSARLRAILEHRSALTRAIFRPDGRAVLTASLDGTAQVWDAATGRAIGPPMIHGGEVNCIAFSPDGRLILTGGVDGKARLWDAATGRPTAPVAIHGDVISYLSFAPDGRSFRTHGSDQFLRFWDAATALPAAGLAPHGDVEFVDFSADGRTILIGGHDQRARVCEIASGGPDRALHRHDEKLSCVRFSPEGRLAATASNDGTVRLWDLARGQPIGPILRHGGGWTQVEFSPDSRRVVISGEDGSARLFETATGHPIGTIMRHSRMIWDASFSPDGRFLLTASFDNTARLWDTATGRPVGSPMRHRRALRSARFSPDGRIVLTASEDGTAKIWEVDQEQIGKPHPRRDDAAEMRNAMVAPSWPGVVFRSVAFSPARSLVLFGAKEDGLARMVETRLGQPVGPPMIHSWPRLPCLTFSPDGGRLATASHDRGIREGGSTIASCQIWDARTLRPSSPLLPHANYVAAMAFRPDGKVLATGDYSGMVYFWDASTGQRASPPLRAASIVASLAYGADGRTLAAGTAGPNHQVILWDLDAGIRRGEPIGFRSSVFKVDFSPDGRRLAAASLDTTALLIDVATGRAIGEPLRHAADLTGMEFSPDGRLLLTSYGGVPEVSAARLWDVATGQPVFMTIPHPGVATGSLAFSPDGVLFASGSQDGTVQLWEVQSGRSIGPPRMLRNPIQAVAFAPDGRTLLAADNRGGTGTWPVPEWTIEPLDELIRGIQVRSGQELDPTREFAILAPEAWRRLRDPRGDLSGSVPLPDDELAWHESAVRDAEAVGDGFAARWHLDRMIAAQPDAGLLHARRACALLKTGAIEPATADLARAIELGPRDRILDWLLQRAEDLRASGRSEDSLRLLDLVAAARPDDWLVLACRARVFAALGRPADREADIDRALKRGPDVSFLIGLAEERSRAGRWESAANLYDRAIELGAVPPHIWIRAAVAHLSIGDEAGYRHLCEVLRGRHPAGMAEPMLGRILVTACTLGPGGVGEDGKPRAWAEYFLSAVRPERRDGKHLGLRGQGKVLYRSGEYRAAIERINQGIAVEDGKVDAEDAIWIAQAYRASGDRARALATIVGLKSDEPFLDFWDTQEARVLRHEAERLILDRVFPDDPFTP